MARLEHAVRGLTKARVLQAWAALLVLLLAAVAWAWVDQRHSTAVDDARTAALEAARTQVVEVLSYKATSVEDDLAAAQSHLTGEFKDEFGRLATELIVPSARKNHITTRAEVTAAGVVSASVDSVKVLLFVTQSTTSDRSKDTKIDASRLEVALTLVGGRWLIEALDPV